MGTESNVSCPTRQMVEDFWTMTYACSAKRIRTLIYNSKRRIVQLKSELSISWGGIMTIGELQQATTFTKLKNDG